MKESVWFSTFGNVAEAHACIPVFCFPFAGGGPSMYRAFSGALPRPLRVHAVHLPGREARIREPLFTSVNSLAAFLAPRLSPFMTGEYYMYGHSLGAVIAFELAVQLMQSGAAAPKHIFVGARRAPHLSTRRAPLHTMDDDAFCTALLQYEGTRAEIFREPELRQLFLPILRADFQMVETYRTTGNDKLTIPITVFGGNRDPFVDQDELNAWRDLTSADCNVHRLDEGHFFSVSGFETIAGVLQTAAQSK